ncbi:MAG: DUF962 domain-containing protein [Bdellovibrionaceae bacterium]|nr:DUF962 domain-containing protein [Pseudobdellovibrionaceae bacterium]MBX3033087.1 DUF962 domain-containing protein [Pseudobdellovibrionaceae bacterium]
MESPRWRTFEEFWPHYLREHRHPLSRRLHFIGTSLSLLILILSLITGFWWGLPAAVVSGYAFAWVGHFFIEKNRPATFTHPWWSLRGDFKMWFLILRGKLPPG